MIVGQSDDRTHQSITADPGRVNALISSPGRICSRSGSDLTRWRRGVQQGPAATRPFNSRTTRQAEAWLPSSASSAAISSCLRYASAAISRIALERLLRGHHVGRRHMLDLEDRVQQLRLGHEEQPEVGHVSLLGHHEQRPPFDPLHDLGPQRRHLGHPPVAVLTLRRRRDHVLVRRVDHRQLLGLGLRLGDRLGLRLGDRLGLRLGDRLGLRIRLGLRLDDRLGLRSATGSGSSTGSGSVYGSRSGSSISDAGPRAARNTRSSSTPTPKKHRNMKSRRIVRPPFYIRQARSWR